MVTQSLGLRDLCSVACASHDLAQMMHRMMLEQRTLHLRSTDDTSFPAAAFVATRLRSVETVHVGGAPSPTTTVAFSELRRRASSEHAGEAVLLPPRLSAAAALFFGAALAASSAEVQVSDGRRICLRALRSRKRVRLRGEHGVRGLCDADIACLLGALSLNASLEELDLCGNPGPSSEAVVRALSSALPHAKLRHHRPLELLGRVVRAAVDLPRPRLVGWLEPWADGRAAAGAEDADEYVLAHVERRSLQS